MIQNLLFLVLFVFSNLNAKTWKEILEEKKELIQKHTCELLIKQYEHYYNKSAPVIADPRIKAITIVENNETTINIKTAHYSRIYMLPNPEKPFESPNCNSGFECASVMRLTVFNKLREMIKNMDLLAEEFGYKPGHVDIAIFEALRDIKTQEQLFQNKKAEIKREKPTLSDTELDAETAKWVSPTKHNVPVHSTGAAVDIRLMSNGKCIDMGKFGVIWGSNPTAPTFSEDITDEQKYNRLYLLMSATMAGLTNYLFEFWHVSYGDRYDAYWNNAIKAQYGSVLR